MAVTCGLPLNGAMASAINALDDIHGGAGQQCMELLAAIDADAGQRDATDDGVAGGARATIAPSTARSFPASVIAGTASIRARCGCCSWSPRPSRTASSPAASRVMRKTVERLLEAEKRSPIPMNIDGATAVIYSELGFAPALGRGIFILSRSVGILAHAWEQTGQGGRIKGPMSPDIPYRYTGAATRSLESPVRQTP